MVTCVGSHSGWGLSPILIGICSKGEAALKRSQIQPGGEEGSVLTTVSKHK